MPTKPPLAPAQAINWKRAFLITLPLAALAIVAAALAPKPLVTIAPYNGTIIRGADVQPADPQPAAAAAAALPTLPAFAPPVPALPYEEAPLANRLDLPEKHVDQFRDHKHHRQDKRHRRKFLRRH